MDYCRCKVLIPYLDREANMLRSAGTVFDCPTNRVDHLVGRGIIEPIKNQPAAKAETVAAPVAAIVEAEAVEANVPESEPLPEDLASCTVAQLRAFCAERGVKVAKGANKAALIAALS